MKYYSDVTKILYDSEKDLVADETKVKEEAERKAAETKKKNETRATRAKEVQEALKAATAATDKAQELLSKFVKDYGYFHTSFSVDDLKGDKTEKTEVSFHDFVNNFLSGILDL